MNLEKRGGEVVEFEEGEGVQGEEDEVFVRFGKESTLGAGLGDEREERLELAIEGEGG